MKKTKLIIALVTGMVVAGIASIALAEEAATITMTGNMVCSKCKLHETTSCQNVIQVEKDGKTVNYYLAKNDVSTAKHGDVCQNDGEKVTVTGTVEDKDGKKVMTATKIEVAK